MAGVRVVLSAVGEPSCNGRTVVTQTGWQSCFGSITAEPRFEKMVRTDKGINDTLLKPKPEEQPPASILSIAFGLFVFLGGLLGLLCIGCVVLRMSTLAAASHLFSLALGSAAFLALAAEVRHRLPDRSSRQAAN